MKAGFLSFTAFDWGIASGIFLGAIALFYFGRKFFIQSKYHHKELRALGFFREQTKTFVDPKTGVVRERVVKATLKVRWKKNQLIFSR